MRLLGLAAIAACGAGTQAVPVAPKEPAVDPQVAEKGAKDLVQELYEDIGHGNTDSMQALLDPKLVVLGPRRGDAVANRADAILAIGMHADAKRKLLPLLKSAALGVFPSDGGHSAWGFDQLDANGEHWAVMVVMSGTNELWSLDAAQLAATPVMATMKSELKRDAIVPPAAGVTVKADASAAGAVEKFQKGLGDPHAWAADLEGSDHAIVIGPTAGAVTRGKKDIKALWKKRIKANTRAMLAGEISGAATRDGMLAWVSAPIMRAEDGEDPTPLRAFAVFEHAGASWNLIGLQESVAVDAPGAGMPFKKFTPAAVVAPPPPADDKKPDKKAKKKKPSGDDPPRKVTTKKRKSVDDDTAAADEDKPKKKKKKKIDDDPPPADDDAPKKKKHAFGGGDGDDDVPKKMKKKKSDDDDVKTTDDDAPKKKKRVDADDDAPKKKKHVDADDDDAAPKKKKKKPVDDDDVKIDD